MSKLFSLFLGLVATTASPFFVYTAAGQTCCCTGGSPESTANCCSASSSLDTLGPGVTVFAPGDGGSKFYRIPAIATTADGTIVAVADRRWDSTADLPGHIDVVSRRSRDGGKTWDETISVAVTDEGGGYGDPAIGIDPLSGDIICVMTHGNGLWQSTPDDRASIVASRSSDGGHTWTMSVEILTDEQLNRIPDFVTAFASSGAIASLPDGRLAFVLVVRNTLEKWKPLADYAVWSSDGGHTWEIAPTTADPAGDEAKLVALPDGRLLMSIRNNKKGPRKFSYSSDGGYTWTEPRFADEMIEPGCNGDILSLGCCLVQTVPANPTERRDVTAYVSRDNGVSWCPLALVSPGAASYSAMTSLPDGSIGFLVEEANPAGGWNIVFKKLNLNK